MCRATVYLPCVLVIYFLHLQLIKLFIDVNWVPTFFLLSKLSKWQNKKKLPCFWSFLDVHLQCWPLLVILLKYFYFKTWTTGQQHWYTGLKHKHAGSNCPAAAAVFSEGAAGQRRACWPPTPRICAHSFRLAPTEPKPSVTDSDDNKLRQGRSTVLTWVKPTSYEAAAHSHTATVHSLHLSVPH